MSEFLLSSEVGRAALAMAEAETDPSSLGFAERLRAHFSPEVASAAVQQVLLRRRAVAKFGERAATMFFTSDGLQQATRSSVAVWRAQRFVEAGMTRVLDLGCGIGADALAFADAGLEVIAVERDPLTAAYAQANLAGRGRVLTGDAVALAPSLLNEGEKTTAVFCDPARRTQAGRTWRVADFSPPWEFVASLLSSERMTCLKLGPGLPKELIPEQVEACWVSDHGDVVEASLWGGKSVGQGFVAVLLPDGVDLRRPYCPKTLPVRAPGRYLLEPLGAVIRAGAISEITSEHNLWRIDPHIAYLSSDEYVVTPFASVFEVNEIIPYTERAMRTWVREHNVGALEIKVRGIDVDPAVLRRRLKLSGKVQATMIISPTVLGARVFIVRRLP